jgi:hypothetical protein
MGPAIKGNDFVLKGKDAELSDVILKGRAGEDKKYKDIPIPMLPQKLNDEEVAAVIAHMKALAK